MANTTSKTSMMCNYLKPSFWMDERNHWWNAKGHSNELRDRMNKLIEDLIKNEKNLSRLNK
jgi:hypothetical protein